MQYLLVLVAPTGMAVMVVVAATIGQTLRDWRERPELIALDPD